MKKKWIIAVAVLILLAAVVISAFAIYRYKTNEVNQKAGSQKEVALENMEILAFDLFSYHEDPEKMEDIHLWLDPENGEADVNGEQLELNEEQCGKLRELIAQYALIVREQEYEYWPHTPEYPDMLTLFRFEIWGEEEERYKADGALCYPDGWEEFIEELKKIIF